MSPTYNVDNKSLEEVFIQLEEDGEKKKVAALSKYFAACRDMSEYVRPPAMLEGGKFPLGAKESWIASTELVVQDFTWLLSLEYHQFWSELVFHKESLDGLVSFLQEAYPYYLLDLLPSDYDITHLYHKTCHLAFLLIKRILARVDSERNWMSEETYSKLLYNNFFISVPMMLDICVVYGHSNPNEVKQLLNYILKVQPFYKEDLQKMVSNMKCVYDSIRERLCHGAVSEFGGVSKLRDRKEEVSASNLEDILLYLLDVSVSLAVFADLCPIVAIYMHQHRLEITLATFYTSFMPDLAQHVKRLCQDEALIGSYISSVLKMNQIRCHIIQLFFHCLIVSLDTSLCLWNWTEEEMKEEVDDRLEILSECLGEKAFMKDLHCRYPLDMQLDKLTQLSNQLDGIKIKFIMDSLPSIIGSPSRRMNGCERTYNGQGNGGKLTNGGVPPPGVSAIPQGSSLGCDQSSSSSSQFQDKPGSSAPVEDSIKELKEIFPHLGEGFLLRCFEYYGNSRSTVLNAILENTLPDELSRLDPELPIIPPDPEEGRPLPQRANVFDNDEFDIMTRDTVDTSRIHRGKRKGQYKDLSDMLNDKCQIESSKDIYSKYSNTWVDEEVEYDDEYDDSYDSVPVPLEEVDADAERRSFVTPRVLEQTRGWRKSKDEPEDDEEEEEEEVARGTNSRHDGFVPFAENPELVRERWQQKKAAKQNPSREYAGKPKGQGQEDQVLFNRHKKNVNKSAVSNHNRRKQAQNKRMRGMVPS